MSDRYAVIAAHRTEFPVQLMCRVLEVSTAGFYAAQSRGPSASAQAKEQLLIAIRTTHARSSRRYGSPRVHRQLRKDGILVSANRVARLMQQDGLYARPVRRFVRTTDSTHADPIAPNLVARAFDVGGALNTTWVADTTFIPTGEGWLYLAIVMDLASRRVLGWATSARNDTALVLEALHRAMAIRMPTGMLWHHSDRGSVYASAAYRAALAARGVTASMSRKGDCWDNAVAESFFATLEWELLDDGVRPTRAAMHRALVPFIDTWYNQQRLHSSLNYQTPIEYEQDLTRTLRAA